MEISSSAGKLSSVEKGADNVMVDAIMDQIPANVLLLLNDEPDSVKRQKSFSFCFLESICPEKGAGSSKYEMRLQCEKGAIS